MRTMTKPNNVRLAATIASLLLVATLIIRTTDAAFTATTENTGNDWAAATISLAQQNATLPFDAVADGALLPGDTVSKCVEIRYDGAVSTSLDPVELYYTGLTSSTFLVGGVSKSLADYLNVTVVRGAEDVACTATAAGASDTDTLSANATAHTGYATGVTGLGWTPASDGEFRAYWVTVELDANAPTEAQAATAEVSFVWEVQA